MKSIAIMTFIVFAAVASLGLGFIAFGGAHSPVCTSLFLDLSVCNNSHQTSTSLAYFLSLIITCVGVCISLRIVRVSNVAREAVCSRSSESESEWLSRHTMSPTEEK